MTSRSSHGVGILGRFAQSLYRGSLLRLIPGYGRPRSALALCYHGVVESRVDQRLERNLHLVSEIRAHVRRLKQWNVVRLGEFLGEIASGNAPRSRPVLITFDDGYANNQLAAELFAEGGLPITIFVTTEAASGSGLIWTVEVSLLLLHGMAGQVELLGKHWVLRDRRDREMAFQSVRMSMKTMASSERVKVMEELRAQFPPGESGRLLEMFPSLKIMCWSQVKSLSAAGVEIGSHGVSHELHHSKQLHSTRLAELADSKREIEERLGTRCISFAYPNGDFCAESSSELVRAGYHAGFTTVARHVGEGSDPFLLPRISPAGNPSSFRDQVVAADIG